MKISDQLKHDFTNNAIRIEVINKMITDKFEQKEAIDKEYLNDLKKFLQDHINYLNKFS